jgi:ferric-dicitrate binding protein FerR (iron transport regulator)
MRFQSPFDPNPDPNPDPNFAPSFDHQFESELEHDWEQFALLSAYLDDQVTAAEIEQVENLLAQDPQFERLYREQCQIRQMLVQMPVAAAISPETLISKVNSQLNHRQKQRNLAVVGLGAIAALCAVSLSIFDFSSKEWSTANINNAAPDDESLVLAMEYPIVPRSALPSLD